MGDCKMQRQEREEIKSNVVDRNKGGRNVQDLKLRKV